MTTLAVFFWNNMILKNKFAAFLEPFLAARPEARKAGLFTICALTPIWAGFSIAHPLQRRGYLDSPLWRLSRDGGYAEYFQYGLLIFSAAAFAVLFFRRREALFAAIAAALSYLALDDALSLHEKAGALYGGAGLPSPVSGAQAAHVGEFLFLGVVGAILLGVIAAAARNASRDSRHAGLVIALLIAGIGFFSAGVDTVHTLTGLSKLGFIEDCGEILMIVLIAAFSVFLIGKTPAQGHDRRS